MKRTLDFYVGVLGMPLVHALKVAPGLGTGSGNRGNPPFENIRHYFLDAGDDSLLAFFEIPKGAKPKGDRDAIGAMQHVSFAVSEERFHQVKANVERAGLPCLGPINVGCETYSIYFYDPNGIRLEFSHQRQAQPRVIERWRQSRREALQELQTLSSDQSWLEAMIAHLPERSTPGSRRARTPPPAAASGAPGSRTSAGRSRRSRRRRRSGRARC